MPRLAYVNGRYRPIAEALVSVQDRGLQFADSVYEVYAARDGVLIDDTLHWARLVRSLNAIGMGPPCSAAALFHVIRETLRRNRLRDALVYLQITRGAAPRDHAFPMPARPSTVIVTARPVSWAAVEARAAAGIAVVTVRDERWRRCDIKATGLLPNVLAKQQARLTGATEAWFVDDRGFITEGASSNAWIIDETGTVITRPLDHGILAGVTRATIFQILEGEGFRAIERAFTREEAVRAREAFSTSATTIAMPVVRLDGAPIGSGAPGPLTQAIRAAYWRRVRESGFSHMQQNVV